MEKTILFVLVLVLGLASVSLAVEGTWTTKADMPTARLCVSTSAVNGKIYAIGGSTGSNAWYFGISTVEEYDPSTDTWTSKTDIPTARTFFSTSAVNGKIYAIGGMTTEGNHLSTVEEYDPATDTWTRKADMPTARSGLATSAVNGKIYAIGGWVGFGSVVSTVEEYDPVTDTWTKKTGMPFGRKCLSSSVVDGKIYAIGGSNSWTVDAYDPATDTWTRKAHMPTARTVLSTSVVNGKIYAIGGVPSNTGAAYSIVQEYDAATDTWTTKANMPTARGWLSSSVVNGKIYAIGGASAYHDSVFSTVEEYNPYYPLIVDFNGDGIVDSADMCIMIDHWGENYSLCDIGPMPWGDGVVDVQDLIVLADHLFEVTLVAHWALDETTGITAHDSVNGYDDYVMGGALWQPAGGVIDGAIEFDGVDDCLITTFGPDPAEGPFSVVAWVKGGAPGQVIISQAVRSDWLMLDASTGTLMTELKNSDGHADPLLSETVITDGQWHHIGLVWSGVHRTLCVDGVAVAEDTQHGLEGSQMGLCFGVGKNYTPGTFFFGLIDDIRILNVALIPEQIAALGQ